MGSNPQMDCPELTLLWAVDRNRFAVPNLKVPARPRCVNRNEPIAVSFAGRKRRWRAFLRSNLNISRWDFSIRYTQPLDWQCREFSFHCRFDFPNCVSLVSRIGICDSLLLRAVEDNCTQPSAST